MKKAFYYLRKLTGEGTHPYACICVAQNDEGVVSRGISICSELDHFSKEIGRKKAFGYAIRAFNDSNVQIEKRSDVAGHVIDNIIGFGKFPAVDSIQGKKKGKYLQSSTLMNPTLAECAGVPSSFIPLTTFEKNLLESL